jgi:hypothetical protein
VGVRRARRLDDGLLLGQCELVELHVRRPEPRRCRMVLWERR